MSNYSFPTDVGIASMTMRMRSSVAVSTSPFTYDQQVFAHQGARWEAEVQMPPMVKANAQTYEAFFTRLNGMEHTFSMANPLHNTVAAGSISGSVRKTKVTGSLSGASVGDYFSVGGSIHIITSLSPLEIMPPLRDNLTNATVDFSLPSGTWRLASNEVSWTINQASIYGFSFACVEAL